MNKRMFQKTKFKKVRIRPIPYEKTSTGLREMDEPWFVENVTNDYFEISNKLTGHSKQIGLDHIKEFMTDTQFGNEGILMLKSQVIIDGNTVYVEPI